jgi:hypothetical protein
MAAQERRRARAPQLTARNYRFFIRGRSAKAGAGDFVVAARKRAALTAYDKLLRRFRYRCVCGLGWWGACKWGWHTSCTIQRRQPYLLAGFRA